MLWVLSTPTLLTSLLRPRYSTVGAISVGRSYQLCFGIESFEALTRQLGNILGSIMRNFDSRFGDKISSFNQHKELVEDEVIAAYLERSLPFFTGLCVSGQNLCYG
jgi:hypothetical protein